MDKLKDFKEIADEIMSDISVGDELKRKTLMQCTKRKHFPVGRVLIPAACMLFVIGLLNFSGILPLQRQINKEDNSKINILADTGESTKALPESANSILALDEAVGNNWTFNTPEEAKASFGSDFLIPAYIPENYELHVITAYGNEKNTAEKVELSYSFGEQTLLITQEKSQLQDGLSEYSSITINGIPGYIKSSYNTMNSNKDNQYTELLWYNNGVHYSISGYIDEEKALKVAEAMK